MPKLSVQEYFKKYNSQKHGAAKRGIEFNLTFLEWCEFWGDDIDRRGVHADQLQMQRPFDSGPYAVGNIVKGNPKKNIKTRCNMQAIAKQKLAAAELQARLNAAMAGPSNPEKDEVDEDLRVFGYARSGIYCR